MKCYKIQTLLQRNSYFISVYIVYRLSITDHFTLTAIFVFVYTAEGKINIDNQQTFDTLLFSRACMWHRGPGSSVGIATGYGLDGPGIESQWGARLSAPAQTGPEAHPASCTMGAGSFPGVKNSRGVTLIPHPLLVPRSCKNRAIPLPTRWDTPGL